MWLREVVCVSDRRTCCFFCRSQPWVGPFDSCFRHHPIQRLSALERGRFFQNSQNSSQNNYRVGGTSSCFRTCVDLCVRWLFARHIQNPIRLWLSDHEG